MKLNPTPESKKCPQCGGSGRNEWETKVPCLTCKGTGRLVPEPELNVEAEKQIERLLHAHANWAHQAIHEQELPVEKKSFIYSPFELSDTVKTKYALLALIQQVSDQRVRDFAGDFRAKMRTYVPKRDIKPNLDDITFDNGIKQVLGWIDNELSDYLSHKEVGE